MNNFVHYTLADWLQYLEERHQQEIQLGLARVLNVARKLDLHRFTVPVITVAGTNGKGSTVAALEAIYGGAGYRTGVYTSPHLLMFNERIRVNQQAISDEDLCAALSVIEQARGNIHLTYFEVATLAALLHFKQSGLDLIILEVGMGGRADATNVVDADLAIITTIAWDHCEYLGDTLEQIGYEKAGILRKNKFFIYADDNPPSSVIEEAKRQHTISCFLNLDYRFEEIDRSFQIHQGLQCLPLLPVPGINLKAAAAAIMAVRCLHERLPVEDANLYDAMQNVFIPCRQQIIKNKATVILDVAHNSQSVDLLAGFVAKYAQGRNVYAVFSALKDKDLCGLIEPMRLLIKAWYPALLQNKRAADVKMLNHAFRKIIAYEPKCYEHPCKAYQAIYEQAGVEDVIVVYGSFHTVGPIWDKLKTSSHPINCTQQNNHRRS